MKRIYFCLVALLTIVNSLAGQPVQRHCQHFDGNQVLMLPNNSQLDLQGDFTMEVWVYLEKASPYGILLGKTFANRSNDPFQNYVLAFDATGFKPEFAQTTGISGSYRTATSPDSILLNTWTHIAATSGSGQMKLYINGTLVASQTTPGNTASTTGVPFSIGSGATSALQTTCCGITGNLMQARVWSQVQSASALQSNLNIQLKGNESGLLAYWAMNDSVGQTVVDLTANAYHLTRGTSSSPDFSDPSPLLISDIGPYFSYSTISLPGNSKSTEELFAMDYNADNRIDFIVSRLVWPGTYPASFAPIQCLKNNGGMNYVNDKPIIGVDSMVHTRDYTLADFNGDGREDIFIADHGTDVSPYPGEQNRLFFQNGTGQLVESTNGNIPAVADFSHNTSSADIDNDGDIDIYVCNIYNQNSIGPRLLINNGTGKFTVNTSNLPARIVNLTDRYMSSRFADIDNDGDMDLVLGAIDNSGLAKDAILVNNGSGVFSMAANALPNRYGNASWGTVAIAVADLNNDGYKDLLMSTLYQYNNCQLQLLINNRNGTFSDSTGNISQSWPASNAWIKWIETGDFNSDGWVDFVVCLFGGQPRLYLNTGNSKFRDVSSILRISSKIASYRARDYDNDDKCDIAFLDFSGNIVIAKNVKSYQVKIDSTGLKNLAGIRSQKVAEDFTFFPNPFNHKSTLVTTQNLHHATIRIVNAFGQTVRQESHFSGRELTIYRDQLPSGTYFILLMQDNRVFEAKRILITD